MKPLLTKLSLTEISLSSPLQNEVMEYWAYADQTVSEVSLLLDTHPSCRILLNGEVRQPNTLISLPLSDGLNRYRISVTTANETTEYTLSIVKDPVPGKIYQDPYRPAYHFTGFLYQLNDPNGLCYDRETGEWHLFFQYNPPYHTDFPNVNATTSWGHAVSKDLAGWQQQSLAIYPDRLGTCWSGSAVIDEQNTSGLFDAATPPSSRMVALYTYYSGDLAYGMTKIGLAYSADHGKTMIKYSDNPVISNEGEKYGDGFRDPKVFWFPDETLSGGGQWVLVAVGGKAQLFSSPDLIHWTFQSSLHTPDGADFDSECPDLFPIPVEGDPSRIKWVYCGSWIFQEKQNGCCYVIGSLIKNQDGKLEYQMESTQRILLNQNPDYYAVQTFYNDPKGRRVQMGWLREFYGDETKKWSGSIALPVELKLKPLDTGYQLTAYPVEETSSLHSKTLFSLKNQQISEKDKNILQGISSNTFDLEAEIRLQDAKTFGWKINQGENGQETILEYQTETQTLTVNRNASGKWVGGIQELSLPPLKNGNLKIRIFGDKSILELFGNDGDLSYSCVYFPDPASTFMEFYTTGGSVEIVAMEVFQMKEMERGALPVKTAGKPAMDYKSGGIL